MAKKPTKARYDSLNVSIELGTLAKAEKLAALLTKEKGVPVSRPFAVDIAINEAIERRTPKGQ